MVAINYCYYYYYYLMFICLPLCTCDTDPCVAAPMFADLCVTDLYVTDPCVADPCVTRLLGQVVDLIDSLMEEWFPGLLETTPYGEFLVRCRAPCIQCPPGQKHMFSLAALVRQAECHDEIECPNHADLVPLALLAPDVVLADLERKYSLQREELQLTER